MYLWKCWRDTRLSFFIYLTLSVAAALFWLVGANSRTHSIVMKGSPGETLWFLFVVGAVVFGAIFSGAIGITLGSRNIGADLATGSAEFVLTRPRSRKYFVWAGWAVGAVEILVLLGVTTLVGLAALYLQGGPVWHQIPLGIGAEPLDHKSAPPDLGRLLFAVVSVRLLFASVVLTTMVMYGLTYLLTVLTRSGQRAIAYTFAIVLAYAILGSVLTRWSVSLPVFTFYLADPHVRQSAHLSPIFQLVLWSICAIALPLAAQFVLHRAEM